MAPSSAAHQAEAARPAILIVDDDTSVTQSLARSLRTQFTVFTANSAADALAIIARERIAVILTDQRMPDVTGVQLLEQARAIRPDACGILISGYTDVTTLVDALNLGNVRGFLPKPWDIHQLRRKVDQALQDYQVGFLERELLRNTAEAVTRTQAQMDELRQALDEVAPGQGDALFAKWERTDSQVSTAFDGAFDHPFYHGPSATTPLRQHDPTVFAELVTAYADLINHAAELRFYEGTSRVPDKLRALSERLGALWASPRDAVEMHTTALKQCITDVSVARQSVCVEEARLLLPELMGNLIVFYRSWLAAVLSGQRP
ncbi:MAG: response regulator [Candidatus Viridilinea halotolerans]|uniref:Response regulator n=1 Tax=Candidatus Viridilinea halotolerans TaxID=2491704 RepID=A0A426UBF6_9CHLR|nr:MAG: response regulator [Candidatus Viridilinea halotolerans]